MRQGAGLSAFTNGALIADFRVVLVVTVLMPARRTSGHHTR